jgi:hypothetical protein
MSIKADVDRGLVIIAELEKLEVELKDIEVRVKQAALHGEQVELKDADREGKQYLAAGTQRVVPVILTADKIMGEFAAKGPKRDLVELAARGRLLEFFKPVNKFENRFDNGKKFRLRAADLLGLAAPAFITACLARDKEGIPKSDIKIMWEESEVAK